MIRKEIIASPDNSCGHIIRYMPWFTDRVCINVIHGDLEFLHNHVWDYVTFVIWGGYKETQLNSSGEEEVKYRLPGYLGVKKAEDFHKITPIFGKAVTLFYRSRRKTKYTSFLIDGKVVRDAKYWLAKGVSKDSLKQRVI